MHDILSLWRMAQMARPELNLTFPGVQQSDHDHHHCMSTKVIKWQAASPQPHPDAELLASGRASLQLPDVLMQSLDLLCRHASLASGRCNTLVTALLVRQRGLTHNLAP